MTFPPNLIEPIRRQMERDGFYGKRKPMMDTDMTTDISGTPWAKLSELKPGDILIPDGGFTCMKEGARMKVIQDHDGSLFLPCNCGGHALVGQADDGEHLVGLYRE